MKKAVALAGLLLALLALKASGQQPVLVLEHKQSYQQIVLPLGKTLYYKTPASTHFQKGKITEIMDSTISFAVVKGVHVTILQRDLTALRLMRRNGRRFASQFMTWGGVSTILVGVGGAAFYDDGGSSVRSFGLVALVGGLMLGTEKKIDLETTWRIKTTKK